MTRELHGAAWFRVKAACWFSPQRDKRGERMIPMVDSFGAQLARASLPIDWSRVPPLSRVQKRTYTRKAIEKHQRRHARKAKGE